MPRTARRLTCLGLLSIAMLGLAACGGGGDDDDDRPGGRGAQERGEGGGEIRVGSSTFPDSLDPALAYTFESWQVLWNVYTPLLTYRHAAGEEGSQLVPGLAEALPEVSDEGRTYTLRLREGLRYSDGTPVRASDFEHTVKRVLNLESGGTQFFSAIAGAEDYLERGRARGDISGITTNDRTRQITIRLAEPDGRFPNILATDFGGLVGSDTPFENTTREPPPGVGPYRVDEVRSNRGFELVRNPRFDIEGLPKPQLDKLTYEVVSSRRRLTQDTISNEVDVMVDPPAPDQIREVRDRFEDERYREERTTSTYFYFLNHDVAPFDDVRVRRAVNFAIDQRAIVRLFGGLLDPSCNFLPPGVDGHREIDPCPYGDPAGEGNIARARALVRQAGAEGEEVIVYGNDEPEFKASAEYLADLLNQIGLRARPRLLEASTYPPERRSLRPQAGVLAWFPDFPHPSNYLFLVDGATIAPSGSPNIGNVDDPAINRALVRANRNEDLEEVAGQYAAIDRRLVSQAHVAPFGHREQTVFMSERMSFDDDCTVVHPLYGLDLAGVCLDE